MVEALKDKMKYLRCTGRPSNKRMLENGSLTAQKKRKEYRAFPAATTPTIPDKEDEHSTNARNYKLMLSESKKKIQIPEQLKY